MSFLFGKRTNTRHNPTSRDNFTITSSFGFQQHLKLRKSVSITATRRLADAGTSETPESKLIFRRKTLASGMAIRTPDEPMSPPLYSKPSRGLEETEMPLDPYQFTELLLQASRARDSASLTEGHFPNPFDSGERMIKAPPPTPRNHRSLSRPSRHHHHHQRPLGGIPQAAGSASLSVPRALREGQPVNGVSTVQFPCVESNRGVDDSVRGYRSLVGVSIAIMEGQGGVAGGK